MYDFSVLSCCGAGVVLLSNSYHQRQPHDERTLSNLTRKHVTHVFDGLNAILTFTSVKPQLVSRRSGCVVATPTIQSTRLDRVINFPLRCLSMCIPIGGFEIGGWYCF
mmetsp:Transcript_877/g.1621  ORF Transcript_877/g.1621 Transcript_877/m.1621 type:complete len:108 (+) Transcript_877:1841-2164(+)